eukprot:jgi/Botrbrau1/527/Bobra.0010s0002.1
MPTCIDGVAGIAAVSKKDGGHWKVKPLNKENEDRNQHLEEAAVPQHPLRILRESRELSASGNNLAHERSSAPCIQPAEQKGARGSGVPHTACCGPGGFATNNFGPWSVHLRLSTKSATHSFPLGEQVEPQRSPMVVGPRLQSSPLPSIDPQNFESRPSTCGFEGEDGNILVTATRSRSERLHRRRTKQSRLSVEFGSIMMTTSITTPTSFSARRSSFSVNILNSMTALRNRSKSNLSQQVSMLWQEAAIPGFEDGQHDQDDDCGICLDLPTDIAIDGCDHRLCADCAFRLCEVSKKPPLCPFCRNLVCGFHT